MISRKIHSEYNLVELAHMECDIDVDIIYDYDIGDNLSPGGCDLVETILKIDGEKIETNELEVTEQMPRMFSDMLECFLVIADGNINPEKDDDK